MLGDGFSHVVSSPWVVPDFGLNWFNQMLGCMAPSLARWPYTDGCSHCACGRAQADCGEWLSSGLCLSRGSTLPTSTRCFGWPSSSTWSWSCADTLELREVGGFSLHRVSPSQICAAMVGPFLALAVLHTVEANRCANYLGEKEGLCTARIGSLIMGYGWLAFASQHCDRTCKFWTDEWRAPHHAAFGQLTWRMFDAICRISLGQSCALIICLDLRLRWIGRPDNLSLEAAPGSLLLL